MTGVIGALFLGTAKQALREIVGPGPFAERPRPRRRTGAPDRSSRVQPLRRTRLRAPDLLRIFRDRPVAGEFPRGGNIENDLVRPIVGLAVERAELTIGPKVRRQVGKMHEM